MTTPARASPGPAAPPTHACVRCGTPIALDLAMCERCNPLGLAQPANSQAHGTVALGIIIAVVVLAVIARVALSGVGPFSGSIAAVVAQPPNLAVTFAIRNDGSREGATTCRVYDPAGGAGIGPRSVFITSPLIGAGQSLTFSRLVTGLGDVVRPLAVECTGP
ncbi:MAG: hypothetical protein FJ038_02180 [Chloroflexi bacterium]|nr:hypothetical protein [Chloroflexota bacterium]